MPRLAARVEMSPAYNAGYAPPRYSSPRHNTFSLRPRGVSPYGALVYHNLTRHIVLDSAHSVL